MAETTGKPMLEWPDFRFWMQFLGSFAVGIFITLAIIAAWIATMPEKQRAAMLNFWSRVEATAPSFNPQPLMNAPATIQIHVIAAVGALVIGIGIFLLPKGTRLHKAFGWSWVIAMIVVAATSVAMVVDLRGGFNALHAFTAITVISLWGGLAGIRRGDVRRHAGSMIGLYLGGLIIAGLFAFIPGRIMWATFFGG